jgi:hypothetical protein
MDVSCTIRETRAPRHAGPAASAAATDGGVQHIHDALQLRRPLSRDIAEQGLCNVAG